MPIHEGSSETQPDAFPTNGRTALMDAAAAGDEERVRTLLDAGADIRAVDNDGDGVLSYAIRSRNVAILEMLMRRGASPNAVSNSMQHGLRFASVLHLAVQLGWSEGAQTLIKYGAEVDASPSSGTTPLMIAASAGQSECVNALCSAGADVNAADSAGDSVLFHAASNGQAETVALLLEQGAIPEPPAGASGITPLLVAAQGASSLGRRPAGTAPSDYSRIVVALLRAGADASTIYRAGFVLQRTAKQGSTVVPLARASSLVDRSDDWSIILLTPEARSELMLPSPGTEAAHPLPTVASETRPQQAPPKRTSMLAWIGLALALMPLVIVAGVWLSSQAGNYLPDSAAPVAITFLVLMVVAAITVNVVALAMRRTKWAAILGLLLSVPWLALFISGLIPQAEEIPLNSVVADITWVDDPAAQEAPECPDGCWVWDLTTQETCNLAQVQIGFYESEDSGSPLGYWTQELGALSPSEPKRVVVPVLANDPEFANVENVTCRDKIG